ncbi:MAG: ATP-binding cassette subfamily F protein 3 [Candidatus Poriferisodalaceae bacterium]
MLTASGLTKAHGPRTLFRDVTIQLSAGRKIALVGGNGMGKTTLIEILLGIQESDAGVIHRPKDMVIGYLPQELDDELEGTVLEVTLEGAGRINKMAKQLSELEARLGDTDDPNYDKILARYGEAQSSFEQLGGYAIEAEAHRVLNGLGFAGDAAQRQVKELSGGWRMRVSLARLLLSDPDVLILDEPTNHLDVDSVAWLEQRLADWNGSLLFVSHDRDFIDSVANRVIELDGQSSQEYVGGFADFVLAREERLAQIEAMAAQQQRKMAHAEQFIERFRYKATKARQVQSRIKAMEKIELIKPPTRKELQARFEFPEPQRSSRIVAEIENASVGYDGVEVLGAVDLIVERGRKIALIGPNGAGKTTLLKMILGDLAPTTGTVTIGNNVDHATFAQHLTEVMDPDQTVLGEFKRNVGDQGMRNLRTILGGFGFRADTVDRHIRDLSGGERTRLALAQTMCNPVNLLILDEPTNHLDLPSCDLLEDALQVYPGTVLLVTHDRHLIRNVADALVEVRDGMAVWHEGVNESILTPGQKPAAKEADRALKPKREAGAEPGRKNDRRVAAEHRNKNHSATKDLRKQLKKAESDWENAESVVADLQAQMADPDTYASPNLIRDLTTRYDAAKNEAARLTSEYETVSGRLERAGQS